MTRPPIRSLGRRLSLWLAVQSLAGLAAVCVAVYVTTLLAFDARQGKALADKEMQVRHLLADEADMSDAKALRHRLDDFLIGHQDMTLALRRADGTAFYGAAATAPNHEVTYLRTLKFAVAVPTIDSAPLYAELRLDTRDDRLLLSRISVTLLAAALVGVAVISAGGYALVKRGLRPVRDLVAQTRQLAAGTLHKRLDGSAQPEELKPLVEQFNALLARLERAYDQMEGFNADVAHELCTPLATLISGTELALRKARGTEELRDVLGSNLEDLHRISDIVQDMLFLSRADRGALARRKPLGSLAALAQKIADYHEAGLADAELRLEIAGDAQGEFDDALLQRALSNLLSNTTRYAQPRTTVRVEIQELDGQVHLLVTNRGDNIAPEHLPRLFDRFYRADPSRSDAVRNHGLGLAIVAAIARMHGGEPRADSKDGMTTIGFSMLSDGRRDAPINRKTVRQ
ncbi:two-component system, OmpR family, heavy metal sensor histidine kinase CusS [Oryzisolibacter propanilivorax]|uniref:Sensor protein n=1 Tax=Oryzisolibacter propanilivorax TaxID=1527607 RepID=A0A1G9TW48_9BURK|nr:heavy metal sensor histidine kinase [Oryzisolibacter propanilivorax]SDM51907.1 two-component system, OmpR family, heavy metal sensor histidine kinase CusS [Oryzisolibacter propanilivorax]